MCHPRPACVHRPHVLPPRTGPGVEKCALGPGTLQPPGRLAHAQKSEAATSAQWKFPRIRYPGRGSLPGRVSGTPPALRLGSARPTARRPPLSEKVEMPHVPTYHPGPVCKCHTAATHVPAAHVLAGAAEEQVPRPPSRSRGAGSGDPWQTLLGESPCRLFGFLFK